jgi:3D (Asp-Asp-Asp) domain-containing protein
MSRALGRVRVCGCVAVLATLACSKPSEPIQFPPVVVVAEYRMSPTVVRGALRTWWKTATTPVRYDEPMPVRITMYCLQGRTRRGRQVRAGIAAADPHLFPLAQHIDLYVGRKFVGNFLIDDTGAAVRGDRIDVWTSDCAEARRFGLRRGLAVRTHGAPQVQLSGSAASPATIAP